MTPTDTVTAVESTIAARKTTKVLGNPDKPTELSHQEQERITATLPHLLEAASWAPFHYPATVSANDPLNSAVPWRCYTFDKQTCNHAIAIIKDKASNSATSGSSVPCIWHKAWDSKIPKLLAGCATMILVTWLPDPQEETASGNPMTASFSPRNVEHVAAASCAVQNLMLSAEARGYLHYWSTGGIFREAEMLSLLDVDTTQITLGTIFIAPIGQTDVSCKAGALRERRGPITSWSRAIIC